ncbi:MAG: NfeD family protein [Candidatus Enterenecus sp.]
MSFGERLQALRRGSGMTQEEFAQQLNVSRQAVSKWESSRGYPEMEKIIYICNHYKVTMDELFQDEVPSARPAQAPGASPPPEEQPLKSPPLKQALSDFLANLSPQNKFLFCSGLTLILIVLLVLFCTGMSMKGESDQMVWKLIWLGLLILFAVIEGVTVGLASIWFAAGALVALIAALLGGQLWLQITLFIVVSALCMLAIRPLAQKHLNSKVEPTNADRVIGSEAKVTEAIDNLQGSGAVNIGGVVWTARSDSDTPIPAGSLVRVLRIEGVKVFVEPVEQKEPVC